jgi:hypothetical protein
MKSVGFNPDINEIQKCRRQLTFHMKSRKSKIAFEQTHN